MMIIASLVAATSVAAADLCKLQADYFSQYGERVASVDYAGRPMLVRSPVKVDGRIDLRLSRNVHVLSSGCYHLKNVADSSIITLVVNNVSPSATLRTFLGVQILQLQGEADEPETTFEISREVPFQRGNTVLRTIAPRVLPLGLAEWDTAHSAADITENDKLLRLPWHGKPQESDDDTWDFKNCWRVGSPNPCSGLNMLARIKGQEVLIQNRLFTFVPAPPLSLGGGVGFEITKRVETDRMFIRYHSPSTQQKGEVELCFRNCE